MIARVALFIASLLASVPAVAQSLSPEAARQLYRLNGMGALLITQPSIVVIIKLGTKLPATAYAGSLCTAKVEIGSQRLLALLPGLGNFLGSSS